MVGTRQTPTARIAVMSDAYHIMEAADDGDDTIDVINQISVGCPFCQLLLFIYFLGAAQFYAALLGWSLLKPLSS
jgi:hypothetical protein